MLPTRAYEIKYRRLTKFSAQPEDFRDHVHEIALLLRTVLEEYLHLKFPEQWRENQDWLGDMIRAIRDAAPGSLLANARPLEGDLSEINEYSQRFHHRTTGQTADIPDLTELQSFAKQTISTISK